MGWEGVRLIERELGAAVEIIAVCSFMCGVAVVGSSDSVAAVKFTADGWEAARLGRSRKISRQPAVYYIYHYQCLDEIFSDL